MTRAANGEAGGARHPDRRGPGAQHHRRSRYVSTGIVLVDLLAYLTGTGATATVLRLGKTRTVQSVIIDPHSPGATLIQPLTDAVVTVPQPSTSDVAVAHGTFLDELAAGRLRHAGQAELTAAIRHGQQRRLGGATAWERRGHDVDASPAVAAQVAVWAWMHRPPKPMIVVSGQAR
jgi:hypothetical protein